MAVPGRPALTVNQVWASGDDDLGPLLEDRGFLPEAVRTSAPIEGMLSQLPKSLAMGMNATAAVAGLGLVAIGLSVGTYFAQRRRDYEFAALRAMGTTPRSIRGTLVLEQVTLLGFALLSGLALGFAMLKLVMPIVGDSLGVTFPPAILVDRLGRPGHRRRGDRGRDRGRSGARAPGAAAVLGDRRAPRGGRVTALGPNIVSTDAFATSEREALIQLRHVFKVYRVADTGVVALAGVDLDVDEGEFLAVVGPSGAGKSTILNLVGGLDRASAGTVEVEGIDLGLLGDDALTRYRAERIGFVWQGAARNLLPYLDLRQNVRLPAVALGNADSRRRGSDELLELVGLAPRARHRPGMLSGGEQQRAAIAIALANTPRILLADEPTAELDSASALTVLDAFRAVNQEFGVTIVMVTHDLVAAARADRRVTCATASCPRGDTGRPRRRGGASAVAGGGASVAGRRRARGRGPRRRGAAPPA